MLLPFSKLSLFLCLTAVSVACVGAYAQESVELEFRNKAPAAWKQFIKERYSDYSARISLKVDDSRFPNQKLKFASEFERYASGDFRFCKIDTIRESESGAEQTESSISATNPSYGFVLESSGTGDWSVGSVVKTTEHFEFDSVVDGKFPDGDLRFNLQDVFLRYPRLEIHQQKTIGQFYAEHKDWFQSFSEREDSNLGRVIKVLIKGELDLNPGPRSKNPQVTKMPVEGEMEFLADYFFLPLNSEIRWMSVDDEGTSKPRVVESFESKYENGFSKSNSLPTSVKLEKNYFPSKGRASSKVYQFEAFSDEELAKLKKSCFLDAFGFSEPEGVSRKWPFSIWIFGTGILLLLVSALVFRSRSKGN